MSAADRWDAKYADWDEPGLPSEFVTGCVEHLADCPTAADLAGGTGGTALWLASQGIDTTLVDVSERALEIARAAAGERSLHLRTVQADLEAEPLPTLAALSGGSRESGGNEDGLGGGDESRNSGAEDGGGWHAVVCTNFLHRPLLGALGGLLVPGGIALVLIATVDNLLYNTRPGRPFLVKRGELPGLCHGLEPISFEEGWFGQRHEARLVARRATSPAS
ncbi:class I SAM-dependent methyltransferase [Candidatus Poriferisodalis sp.]|uniref:class I SAM-dependent methyltransferase n=1 Tax=Candidatus Poriferisodalis sp. TaxID=3101277 RepID=UPI003B522759